jgi:hypothetical protein
VIVVEEESQMSVPHAVLYFWRKIKTDEKEIYKILNNKNKSI